MLLDAVLYRLLRKYGTRYSAIVEQSEMRGCRLAAGKSRTMSKSYVIEVGSDQAGVIIREEGERDYRFHAALESYNALEGRRFPNAYLAERAAIAHAASRRRRRVAVRSEAYAL